MSEQIYDELIAPKLLEIGKLCEEHGLPVVAQVEYAPGDFGLTQFRPDGASLPMKLMAISARCGGNVDTLFMAIERHAREHGHGSIYLHRLGVPITPDRGAA
ncbi:hypothetical protein ASE85_02625 [Sphingobium sp. Leaf26]|uniref:hypothetical protein n=1 Tax=Sphingobium sp. Leaf26 TaxID=1735693 RepID=UPI0006F9AED9|nr:hypothetical protein [Sphingobium sp. Leaf26]KQN09849.1 hypothetical protein ASE85_02625 [Sphingobium sp. Leaf26]